MEDADGKKELKKVGVYVDEETWERMKEYTFRKHSTTRKLSREVREILKANLPLRLVKEGVRSLDIPTDRIRGEEVKDGRAEMPSSSTEIVKGMRARP
ncbi:hypothetical protein AKJ52_01820 [candidate division MSBL1 archaeon SCGC-AAA382C18]|uniref:Uncharacterized protein n=1 Tax=candidate division MSBL1 archaeon SCGC-AAA382C18 TaxID=1698281 RepID=A0A133VJS6_9EURY|nr:hypothetical protein AKJ52_01820 [candidate division MSBL1 archaeon SCGC-AAA382C18]